MILVDRSTAHLQIVLLCEVESCWETGLNPHPSQGEPFPVLNRFNQLDLFPVVGFASAKVTIIFEPFQGHILIQQGLGRNKSKGDQKDP